MTGFLDPPALVRQVADAAYGPRASGEVHVSEQAGYSTAIAAGTANPAAVIAAAFDAAEPQQKTVVFPKGTFLLAAPFTFRAPFRGQGEGLTTIKRSNVFTGNHLLDFNHGTEDKRIADITFDCSGYSTQAWGSSGDASGSSRGFYERVKFIQCAADTYAVGGASTTNVGGMLTGSTFINCRWQNCGLWLNVGQNQDDVLILNPRFQHVVGGTGPAAAPLVLAGQNISVHTAYMYVVESSMVGSVRPVVEVGSATVSINGLFIEGAIALDYTHLISAPNFDVLLKLEHVLYGITTAPEMVSLVRARLHNGTLSRSSVSIDGLYSHVDIPALVEVNATASTGGKALHVSFSGGSPALAPVAFAPESTSSVSRVNVHGVHQGALYGHYLTPAAPTTYVAMPGPA